MLLSIFFPIDNIRPGDLLNQYTDWIYFILMLAFFISIAGLTFRKHFEKPYVKPLIITVGFMMTIGVFLMKDKLTMIFQGWGILGSLILVFVAATIPYGLCRGFGLPANRAFYIVYALFYILSWVKFPEIYYALADRNMGLVNLGLLILFVVAIYKIVTLVKGKSDLAGSLKMDSPIKKDIGNELEIEEQEGRAVENQSNKVTKFEIRTVKDMEESLVEMIRVIEAHNTNLTTKDREKISVALKNISKKEGLFRKTLLSLKQLLQRLRVLDEKQIQEMRNRMNRADGKQKQNLEAEINMEVEKMNVEREVLALEEKLEQGIEYFHSLMRKAIETLNGSAYPADAIQSLSQARMTLKNIMDFIDKMKKQELILLEISLKERNALKREKKDA